jgi:hypothetical protein
VRSGRSASRRPTGPFLGLRGAPRTRIRPALDGHGFPSGPCGVSTPFGLQPGRTTRPDCSGRGPPCAFASLQRPTAAHPHRPGVPKDPRGGRCSLPWAFALLDTSRNGGPAVVAGLPAPRVPRPRFGHLLRGVHHRPCGRLAAPERPRASPYQAFSSRRSASLPEDPALVTLRSSIRPAPRGSRTDGAAFKALIPTRARARRPLRDAMSMPAWASPLQSSLSSRPRARVVVRARSPSTRWAGLTSRPACVSGCSGAGGPASPLSGSPALLGFRTFRPSRHRCDRRGGRAYDFAAPLARLHSRGWSSTPPRCTARPRLWVPTRRRRPSVNGCCLFFRQSLFFKERMTESTARASARVEVFSSARILRCRSGARGYVGTRVDSPRSPRSHGPPNGHARPRRTSEEPVERRCNRRSRARLRLHGNPRAP